jgi:uncharacterized Fe-S cluster-containing radical SAM superfamily protein
MQGGRRKYYRFRASRHYGGIVTADAVGCCLLCAYCWNLGRNEQPEKHGNFYPAEAVKEKLLSIAQKKGIRQFRISGAEPILGEASYDHLLDVITAGRFVIETNGIILGYRPDLIDRMKGKNVLVRVSIKGWDKESFERLSGAGQEYFKYPFIALKRLTRSGIDAWPAVMGSLFGTEGIRIVAGQMKAMGIAGRIETEYLERYPFVINNLKRRGWETVL